MSCQWITRRGLRLDRLLTLYLREQLQGKVILFLGCDPSSPDFALLVEHVLNGYLGDLKVQAFCVWPENGRNLLWGGRPIRVLQSEPLPLIAQLTDTWR